MATNIYTDTESYCMEKLIEEFKTITWSSKLYTPSDLAKMKNSFPIIVKISSSKLGDRFYEDYSSGQALYLHSIKEQLRFLAYDEEGNEFSIPINSDIGLETADTQEDLILHEHLQLPVEIKFKFDSDQCERLPDLLRRKNNTVLTIKQKGLMKYLMAVCMSEDVFVKAIECIPAESSNLGLSVALNIGDGMDDRLTLFEKHVQNVVQRVIDESTFNSYQGNPDIIINAYLRFKMKALMLIMKIAYTSRGTSMKDFKMKMMKITLMI
ncbi:uncharacterized protein [Antedon mediterranea]|uniref:uncharacterized protein n=1 Tax=Antedon mediterranea TaxID=105859 RepID=UPI003AF76DED